MELSSKLRQIADSIDADEKPDRQTIASQIHTALNSLESGKPPINALSSVVAVLRAAQLLHHTHHWIMTGPQFYGDHLLLQRLYEGISFDAVGEKTVCMGGSVCPIQQTQAVGNLISKFATESEDPESLITASLAMEEYVLEVIDQAKAQLEQEGNLSNGLDNLLQGIADSHETFVYLLKQRLK